jgi:MFS transporter, SP family, general alpha glucoside:H+ symporter
MNTNTKSSGPQLAHAVQDEYKPGSEAALHINHHGLLPELTLSTDSLPRLDSTAAAAAQDERQQTFKAALQRYPKAIAWSVAISLAIVMEGYQTSILTGYYSFPQFTRVYGVQVGPDDYLITNKWQSALGNSSVAGSVVGLLANGLLTEFFGYRKTMLGALFFLAAFIFLPFFATNIDTLLAGQVLCGLSWGIFSTLTTTYAAEMLPVSLRGYLTAGVNLCWILGQIVAQGTLRGCLDIQSEWSYRIPFGVQWVWIVIVFGVMVAAPESPWWLIRQDRVPDAQRVLQRLTRSKQDDIFNVEHTIAMMLHTNEVEKHLSQGRRGAQLSYLEAFRGTSLRRTEIASMIFMIQNLSGLPVIGYAAYLYTRIGFSQKRSYDLTIGMHGIAILANFLSFVLMRYFGRRMLYLAGLIIQLLILLTAGILSTFAETATNLWATAGLIIAFIFVFDLIVGPLTYTIVAEIPSTRLRVKTVVLARVAYNLCSLATNPLQNAMLSPLKWNWRAKSCFFWAGSCFLCLVYCFFRLPESQGLTYLELDLLFEKRANARKFADVQKRLASAGYFELQDDGRRRAQWVETIPETRQASVQELKWPD